MASKQKIGYTQAGVNIDEADRAVSAIRKMAKRTFSKNVLTDIGSFGGGFLLKGWKQPVLVSSADGVGTKLKLAFATGRHDTIGEDLVNHCVNDIAVLGARPLFFLDYIGAESLDPRVFDQLLAGFAKACKAAGCALIGGETAQMPGMYRKGEYDLAGSIVGVVDRPKMIDGSRIRRGDIVLGLPSNGLHTNGYSLARQILFEKLELKPSATIPGVIGSLGEELLRVHKNYQPLLAKLRPGMVRGLAHITGGGLIDNLPRILPDNCDALIETRNWRIPPIFEFLERQGKVDRLEMFQVFNMGIGMVAIVSEKDSAAASRALKAKRIGTIVKGTGETRLAL